MLRPDNETQFLGALMFTVEMSSRPEAPNLSRGQLSRERSA
jgi:hypothetical protein